MFPLRRVISQVPVLSLRTTIRPISSTPSLFLKKINRVEEGNKIVINAEHIPSPRENYLVKFNSNQPEAVSKYGKCTCCLCKLGLHIQHTDVLVLQQFMNTKGRLISNEVTGLCKPQHQRMKYLIVMAEKAGLIDVYTKAGTKRELKGYEVHNKYYDESVIEEFVLKTDRRARA